MNAANLTRLVLMAAIGGGSFFLMRMAAPQLGPMVLAESRLLVAAVFLLLLSAIRGRSLALRANARHYLVLGLFSFALPVLLFAYAAQTVPASLMAILNATSPIFGAVLAAARAHAPLPPQRWAGLVLGATGVAVLVGFSGGALHPVGLLAVLGAAFSYGVATVYAASARQLDPVANAHGSTWAAVVLLAPVLLLAPGPLVPLSALPLATVGQLALVVLLLGVFCTGVAFLLYFRLVSDLGPTSALTVTFLVPMFGVLWGYLFLDEAVHWHTAVGAAIVIGGTALTMGASAAGARRWLGRARPPSATGRERSLTS